MYNQSLFASKQTFARIDYLRQGEQLADKKGTFNVKFPTKKIDKIWIVELTSWQADELMSLQVNEFLSWWIDKFTS